MKKPRPGRSFSKFLISLMLCIFVLSALSPLSLHHYSVNMEITDNESKIHKVDMESMVDIEKENDAKSVEARETKNGTLLREMETSPTQRKEKNFRQNEVDLDDEKMPSEN